jgi:hypothetical protein
MPLGEHHRTPGSGCTGDLGPIRRLTPPPPGVNPESRENTAAPTTTIPRSPADTARPRRPPPVQRTVNEAMAADGRRYGRRARFGRHPCRGTARHSPARSSSSPDYEMSVCHAPPSWGAPIDMRLGSPTWWILAAIGAGDLLLATNPDGPVDSYPSRRNTYSLVVDQTWHSSQLECGGGIRAKRVDLRTSSRIRTSTPRSHICFRSWLPCAPYRRHGQD